MSIAVLLTGCLQQQLVTSGHESSNISHTTRQVGDIRLHYAGVAAEAPEEAIESRGPGRAGRRAVRVAAVARLQPRGVTRALCEEGAVANCSLSNLLSCLVGLS